MYEVMRRGAFVYGAHPGRAKRGGRGPFDGVILAGWRTGARVHVVYQRYPAIPGIRLRGGASGHTCFVGTIHVGRAPRD